MEEPDREGLNSYQGFTLIELVITLGVIGLLLATGIPAFRGYGRQVEFDNTATSVADILAQARTLSLAPEATKPSDVTAYGVGFNTTTRTVSLGRYTTADQTTPITSVKTVTLSRDVTLTTVPNGPILFPIALQGEPVFPSPTSNQIVLTNSRLQDHATRTLTIQTATGQVSIQ